jgi:tetratricopeptide (TPR) repeat protein
VKALSTKQILERLERALPLLTGGARDVPERQRTLRGAIGWSYELLVPDEWAAFRRLGVFSGGWSLDAAEQVAGPTLDTLQSLVEKSLVRFGDERYSLLETIREFAAEQLEEAGESEEARRGHFGYFAGLAAVEDTSAEAGYGLRAEALMNEQENLRAALNWAGEAGELERAVELMVLLENFWVTIDPIEGAHRFEELLASDVDLPDQLRARAARCYAGSLFIAGEYERSHPMNEQSLALFRALGDDEGTAVLLHRIAISTLVHLQAPAAARELLAESREHYRLAGSGRGESEVVGALGYVAKDEGDTEGALELFTRAAEIAAETGFTWWEIGMLDARVECLIELGRIDEAEPGAKRHLELARSIGERQHSVLGLALHAWIAARRGDLDRAQLLWGAVEAEEGRGAVGQWESERDVYAAKIGIRSDGELGRARIRGRGLSLQAAIDEALTPADAGGP